MTAAATLVQINTASQGGLTLKNKANAAVTWAADATQAKELASAMFDGDGHAFGAATTTILADPTAWTGFTARVVLSKTGQTTIDVSATGDSDDSFSDIMGKVVTALNATAINGAAFSVDTLKVAETTDSKGDWQVEFLLTAPNGARLDDLYVATVVDGGSSGDAVTVAFTASGTLQRTTAPTVVAGFGG